MEGSLTEGGLTVGVITGQCLNMRVMGEQGAQSLRGIVRNYYGAFEKIKKKMESPDFQ